MGWSRWQQQQEPCNQHGNLPRGVTTVCNRNCKALAKGIKNQKIQMRRKMNDSISSAMHQPSEPSSWNPKEPGDELACSQVCQCMTGIVEAKEVARLTRGFPGYVNGNNCCKGETQPSSQLLPTGLRSQKSKHMLGVGGFQQYTCVWVTHAL